MPKSLLFIAFILLGPVSFVYGQMLSSFQSPQYFRMLSRSASTDIDGIIYNPAGLSNLDEGWHFLVSGQFSPFEKVVDSEYPSINTHRYTSRTYTTPSPTLFAVHNKERWAWSLGFGQNLGEGASNFSGGIPSFEIYTSRLLNHPELGIEDYTVTQNLQISPENYTVQAGATFKMSDIFSIYAGVRMTSMKYDISGFFKNARVKIAGQLLPASSYLATVGATYRDKALGLAEYTTALKEIGDAGAAYYSLDMMQTVGVITEAEKNRYIAELIALGKTTANGSWTVSQAFNEFDKAQKTTYDKGTDLINTGLQYQDRNIDVRKSGFGITPIIGFNLQPSESVNMGFFYEYKGYIRTKTRSVSDFNNIFADNDMLNKEIPSLFSAGIGLRVNPYTEIQFSYRLYFTKEVSWGYNFREKLVKDKFLKRDFENHDFDLALGLQFHMTDNFDFSIGGMSTQPGAAPNFQSDFNFTNPSYTVAGGFRWRMNEQLTLDAGIMSTFYKDAMVIFTDTDLSTGKYYETYGKNAMGLGIGLSYSIEKYYRRRY